MLTIVDRVEPSPGEDSRPSLVSIHFYVRRPAAAATTTPAPAGVWAVAGVKQGQTRPLYSVLASGLAAAVCAR